MVKQLNIKLEIEIIPKTIKQILPRIIDTSKSNETFYETLTSVS